MRQREEFGRLFLTVVASLLVPMFGHTCTSIANSTNLRVGEPNDLRWDLAQAFCFKWNTVGVSAGAMHPGPDGGPEAGVPVREIALSVSVDFNSVKAKGLVIVDMSGPQISEVIDGNGRQVVCQSGQSDLIRGYDDLGWYWDGEGRAATANKLSPFTVKVRLADDPKQHMPSSISRLQAYIYALYADAIIRVDLPFDPNMGWLDTEAAPDLTLLVDPLTPPPPAPVQYVSILPNMSPTSDYANPRNIPSRPKVALGSYTYTTWVNSKTGQRVLGLRDPRYPSASFGFGNYAVVRTELFDSRRNTGGPFKEQQVSGTLLDGRYGACCSGQLLQGDGNTYDKIRHIIVVHPVEVKIPFVLRTIPLPAVGAE